MKVRSLTAIATAITATKGIKIIFGHQIEVGVCPCSKHGILESALGRRLVKFLRDDQRLAALFRVPRQTQQHLLGDEEQI